MSNRKVWSLILIVLSAQCSITLSTILVMGNIYNIETNAIAASYIAGFSAFIFVAGVGLWGVKWN